jgi:hypothetical protein
VFLKGGESSRFGRISQPKISSAKDGCGSFYRGRENFGSNRWICHTGKRIWLIGVDTNENLFASFDPPSNRERDERHD